jgi:hypothetical protein
MRRNRGLDNGLTLLSEAFIGLVGGRILPFASFFASKFEASAAGPIILASGWGRTVAVERIPKDADRFC